MREFTIPLTKALRRGLRPWRELPNEPEWLEECYNLMPSEAGLRAHEPLTNFVGPDAGTVLWPWPRCIATGQRVLHFHRDGSGTLHIHEVALNTANAAWTSQHISNTFAIDSVSQIDVADFGQPYYIVATLGKNQLGQDVLGTLYYDSTQPAHQRLQPLPGLSFGTVCNFRQQCVAANVISPTLTDLSVNSVIWSGISNAVFDPALDRTAGFKNSLFPASAGSTEPVIYKVLPLQDAVVVYSDAGRALLVPSTVQSNFTYSEQFLPGLGLASGNHVAGDQFIHGFIDLDYDFWLLEQGGRQNKRGYRPQIKALFDQATPVIVSYVPLDQRFYVSNGQQTLIINKFGACTIHEHPSGIFVGRDRKLYATFVASSDRAARIACDATDFGERGLKTVESIMSEVHYDEALASCSFSVDYSMTNGLTYNSTPWRPGGPRGAAAVRCTALSFKIKARITDYTNAQISSLDVNVKFPDARFRRGVVATPGGGVEAQV